MKLMAIMMFGLASSAWVHADVSQEVFNGMYTLSEEGCDHLYDRGYETAYVSLGKDAVGVDEIRIRFFGTTDPRLDSILLGSGTREPLGTSEPLHGRVNETWKTTFASERHLVSKTKTVGPNNNFEESAELEIKKEELDLIYSFKTEGERAKIVCRLHPTLSAKQKVRVCEQIKINQPALKALTVKKCTKEGNFEVNSNDPGQLGVIYTNDVVVKDKSLTCEVNFDKPLGRYEPAVEQCVIE